jgi:hypothetical protein
VCAGKASWGGGGYLLWSRVCTLVEGVEGMGGVQGHPFDWRLKRFHDFWTSFTAWELKRLSSRFVKTAPSTILCGFSIVSRSLFYDDLEPIP